MVDSARDRDRPNKHHTVVDWVALVFVLAYAALHVYHGLNAGQVGDATSARNFVVAGVAVGGIAVYFSSYWRPVLYLVGAVFVGTLTVFWRLTEPVNVSLEVSRVVLIVVLVALLTHLFNREQTRYVRADD